MATRKQKVTGERLFQRLAAIAKLVLVLPHSNADPELVFFFNSGTEQDQDQEQLGPGWNSVINYDNKDGGPGALLQVGDLPSKHQGLKKGHKPRPQGIHKSTPSFCGSSLMFLSVF